MQTFWNLSRLLGRNSHWVFGHTAINSCLINSASAEDLEWKVGFSRTINLLKLVKPNNFFLHISRLVLTSLLTLFQYKGSQSLQHWGMATLTRNCFTRNRQGLSCFCSRITPSRMGRLFVRHHATNVPYFFVIETLTFILGDFLKNREASQNRSPEATALVQSPNMSMPNNKPMQETHYII